MFFVLPCVGAGDVQRRDARFFCFLSLMVRVPGGIELTGSHLITDFFVHYYDYSTLRPNRGKHKPPVGIGDGGGGRCGRGGVGGGVCTVDQPTPTR